MTKTKKMNRVWSGLVFAMNIWVLIGIQVMCIKYKKVY